MTKKVLKFGVMINSLVLSEWELNTINELIKNNYGELATLIVKSEKAVQKKYKKNKLEKLKSFS
ncbi:hypothetical protein OAK75_12920, partial [Bacteriovoracales bacterium]|nr:hypothetical protein [Bacteriovoracales bacterium]